LDLKNFHEGSHNEKLIPILVSTKAKHVENIMILRDNLYEPLKANRENLPEVMSSLLLYSSSKRKINIIEWESSRYKPTPTIIEAAQALYTGHNVKEISRHDAGAINLSRTTDCINQIIENTKSTRKKSICFLTGVPGAGKTLAGLNIANERQKVDEGENAIFLSGNGPLVDVLREALARDEVKTAKDEGKSLTKTAAFRKAVSFIQNIHHFRDDNLKSERPPIEKVVVFDEAQRAWAKEQVRSFMKRKKGIEDFNMSEPEYLLSVMNKHDDWCVIICLIGGGQEINTGEAGVSEWLIALKNIYPYWEVYYSNIIQTDNNYLSNFQIKNWLQISGVPKDDLHLSVCVRSFRSEKVSELMHEILEGNCSNANKIISEIVIDFPIYLSRNISQAKSWLRDKARGTEKIGVIASSKGKRLRPLGIDVKNEIFAPYWFLNPPNDVRSSNYLEEVATEFDIQGLEIDWVCLAWDIDFYYKNNQWNFQYFEGTTWRQMRNEHDRIFLKNAYRVLLTRARQGIIIFIPIGDDNDITRLTEYYNKTAEFLKSCGVKELL
jgi:hypothetical protein